MAQAATSEVHPDPDDPTLVGEHIDIVVAASDRAELTSSLGLERVSFVLAGNSVPGSVLEEGMVVRGIRSTTGAADAKADLALDLVRNAAQLSSTEAGEGPIGTDGSVAAGNVESDTHDAGMVTVGRHTSDRHDISLVAIGHEGDTLSPLGDNLELGECLGIMLAEDSTDAQR